MFIDITTIPKVKQDEDGTSIFGTSWLVSISGTDDLCDIIEWCKNNINFSKIQYYNGMKIDRMTGNWVTIENFNKIPRFKKGDFISIHMDDDTDVMAFKLKWE